MTGARRAACVGLLLALALAGCGGGGNASNAHPPAKTQPVGAAQPQGRPSSSPTRTRPRLPVQGYGLVEPGTAWASTGEGTFWTDDAGRRWHRVAPRHADQQSGAVWFLDRQDGWTMVKEERHSHIAMRLYRTLDGGRDWLRSAIVGEGDSDLGGVRFAFADRRQGFLMVGGETMPFGYGVGFTTSDGGRRWRRLAWVPGDGEIGFTSPDRLWLSKNEGGRELFLSTDLGRTWSRVKTPLGSGYGVSYPVPIRLADGRTIFPILEDDKHLGLYTRGAGGWHRLLRIAFRGSYGGGASAAAVLRPPDSILISDPGRKGFTVVHLGRARVSTSHLAARGLPAETGMRFVDPRHGIAILNGECGEGCLYFTGGGGARWSRRQPLAAPR